MKSIRRMLSLALAFMLVISMAVPAYAVGVPVNFTVTPSSETCEVGDTIFVTFHQDVALSNVGIYELLVYYDKDMVEWDKDATVNGSGMANAAYAAESPTEGDRIKFSNVDVNGSLAINAGNVNKVAFKVKQTGPITFTCKATVVDSNFNAYDSVTCTQTVSVTAIEPEVTGYTVSASEDVTATVGGSAQVTVNVTGHSDANITTYNDYDMTVSYDTAKLTYAGATTADSDATITHDETAGTIHITGHGAAKAFSNAVATLNFTAKTSGNANVQITSVKIDNSGNAISANAPDAHKSDDTTVIKVAYPVTLPEGFTGKTSVLPGESYTFTAPNEHYNVTVTVGGATVTPTVSGTSYTIANVNGAVKVTAAGKTYTVTVAEATTATVSAPGTATYGTDYTFTVTPSTGKQIDQVTVTLANGSNVSYEIKDGKYVIKGTDITGDLTITVTEMTPDPETTTSVTISGITAEEINGGSLTLNATNGQNFQFTVIPQDGYTYTAQINGTSLNFTVDEETGYITFTIPANMIDGTALTVTITKTPVSTGTLKVEVTEYITLDEKAMFLVTATDGDKVLAYGEDTMYWSEKYQAYSWLVVSAKGAEAVKAAAEAAITAAAEDAVATSIAYDCDVNQTTVVDINDAQLTYDMYTRSYEDFTRVTMDKFLEADLADGDSAKKLDVSDATAIVNSIPSRTN